MRHSQFSILNFQSCALALACLLLASCNEVGVRDNVTDPYADNYDPQAALSSGRSSSNGSNGMSSANGNSSSSSWQSPCAGASGTCFAYAVAENSAVGTLVGTLSTATSNK